MPEPYQLTIAEAAGQIKQKRLSPVELMQSLLARADALEPEIEP